MGVADPADATAPTAEPGAQIDVVPVYSDTEFVAEVVPIISKLRSITNSKSR